MFRVALACLLASGFLGAVPRAARALAIAPLEPRPAPAMRAIDQVADLVAKLKNQNDAADPKLIHELSGLKTREAMAGLVDVYDAMHTIFMRREIVRALIEFDGVPDAEQPALQKMMDVATTSEEIELRNAALDALGDCKAHGKDFLMMIVRSPADDAVREKAMKLHIAFGDQNDFPFYREVYKPKTVDDKAIKDHQSKFAKHDINKKDKDKDKKKEEDPNAPKKPRVLESLRLQAFEALSPAALSPEELAEATKDDSGKIRASALQTLETRAPKVALELAIAALDKSTPMTSESFDKRLNERAEVRVVAAGIVGRLSGAKAAPELIKRALSVDTPLEVKRALAESLVAMNDPALNRELADKLTKSHPNEKLLGLWASRSIKDDKLGRSIVKLIYDKDPDVVVGACQALAVRKDVEFVPELQKLVEHSKEHNSIHAALDAMAVLRGSEPAWIDELVKLTKNDDPEVRALAVTALAQVAGKSQVDKLTEALNDPSWSTRLAALDALEHIHVREVIGPIIDRMSKEDGRLLRCFIDALWRMTGQPFDDNAEAWANWWKSNGASFELLTDAQVKKLEVSEEEWRLKQTTHVERRSYDKSTGTKPKFFGIRIISHHVLFIIDVSGSMTEGLTSVYEGKTGLTKIDIAKAELEKCILGLEPTAFFNIITFSSDVRRWFEGRLAAASPKNLDEAKAYVDKLLPFGATNTYDALKEAFKDPDVDTIFLMSDGEPTVSVSDPMIIREHVKQWNEHRDITINTIAVGGKFQILEWLAEDSGGTHIKYE
jgi:HEAT repeat protein